MLKHVLYHRTFWREVENLTINVLTCLVKNNFLQYNYFKKHKVALCSLLYRNMLTIYCNFVAISQFLWKLQPMKFFKKKYNKIDKKKNITFFDHDEIDNRIVIKTKLYKWEIVKIGASIKKLFVNIHRKRYKRMLTRWVLAKTKTFNWVVPLFTKLTLCDQFILKLCAYFVILQHVNNILQFRGD